MHLFTVVNGSLSSFLFPGLDHDYFALTGKSK